jgi:hypothetical protein
MQQVRLFKPRQIDGEYAVDVAFRSRDPRETPEFRGVRAGMAGRQQPGTPIYTTDLPSAPPGTPWRTRLRNKRANWRSRPPAGTANRQRTES